MVKPEFWDDEILAQSTSRDTRLLFIGMWNQSDDYGSVKGNAVWLKSKIFPYDAIKPETFQKWLDELEKGKWILPYVVAGANYFYIRAFTKHQVINRPSKQRNPEPPPEIIEDSLNTHGVLIDEVKYKYKYKEKENIGGKSPIPPPIDDVILYCKQRKNNIDAHQWFDHYEARGWMIGKNRMKDWRAAVRTWERNEFGNNGAAHNPRTDADAILDACLRGEKI